MRGDMIRRISKILAAVGATVSLAAVSVAEPLELGKAVPAVEGTNHKGKTLKINEVAAEGWVLFFFYPKALTGG